MWASVPWLGEGGEESPPGDRSPLSSPLPSPTLISDICVGSAVLGGVGFLPLAHRMENRPAGKDLSPRPQLSPRARDLYGTKLPCPLSLPVTTPSFKGLSRNKHLQYFLDGPVGENEPLSTQQLCQLASMSRMEEGRWVSKRDGGLGCSNCAAWDAVSHFSNPDLLSLPLQRETEGAQSKLTLRGGCQTSCFSITTPCRLGSLGPRHCPGRPNRPRSWEQLRTTHSWGKEGGYSWGGLPSCRRLLWQGQHNQRGLQKE